MQNRIFFLTEKNPKGIYSSLLNVSDENSGTLRDYDLVIVTRVTKIRAGYSDGLSISLHAPTHLVLSLHNGLLPLLRGSLMHPQKSALLLVLVSVVFSTKNICTSIFHKVSITREEG